MKKNSRKLIKNVFINGLYNKGEKHMENIKLININQASAVLNIHPQTLRKMVKKGQIKHILMANKYMFLISDLVEYVVNKRSN